MTVRELASKCNSIPHILKPLLDSCVSMGLLDLHNDEYMNSHFSRIYLTEGGPFYVGDLIKLQYFESNKWNSLYDIILGNQEQCEVNEEIVHRTFIRAMHNLGDLGEADALCNAVDLSGCTHMVDAGGGSGIYSIALCKKYPDLRSTILDRSETLAITKELIAEYEERERITLREADIEKDSFGDGIDAVLLSDVVYDQATAGPVLANARNSLREGGILVVRGYYSDPEISRPLFGALFVLGQLVFDPEREVLSISSLEDMVIEKGFIVTRRSPLTERSFVLLAEKP
jgi:SAM-dependent methyltransferase